MWDGGVVGRYEGREVIRTFRRNLPQPGCVHSAHLHIRAVLADFGTVMQKERVVSDVWLLTATLFTPPSCLLAT